MLILAVDTTTQQGSLAVLRDTALLGVVSTASDEAYSSRLFRQLEFLLAELQLRTADFDLFAVAAGPGSFTGVRVGLTAVKGWAEVYNKPIAAISALEAVAMQSKLRDRLIAPIIDARRGQVFAGLYDPAASSRGSVRLGDDVVMSIVEFFDELHRRTAGRPVQLITPTPDVLRPSAEDMASRPDWPDSNWQLELERVSPVLAPVIGTLGWERAQRGELTDALHLDAHYVRRSDAEVLWKEK